MQLHQPTKRDQPGFSIIEVLLVILVVAALAVTGLIVYQRHKPNSTKHSVTTSAVTSQTQTTTQPQNTVAQSPPANPYDGWKTFASSADHFSLKYPPTWILNMTNAPFQEVGYDSGTLTSPSKTVLNVYANTGGRGGDCQPRLSDVPFQKGDACPTLEYLSSEKLPISNVYYMAEVPNSRPSRFVPEPASLYLVTTQYADQNGSTSYGIGVVETTTQDSAFTLNTPHMGYVFPWTELTVYNAQGQFLPYVYLYANSNSPSFLTSDDATTIKTIIRSFTLNI